MKLKSLIESGDPELLDTGFEFTEGPLWMDDLGLLFSDIPDDKIYRWTEESGTEIWRDGSGNANGLAQDVEGNVWYFGELSMEFEDGEPVGLEGSWEAGEDGAKPGIVMWANPEVGEVYRQEFFLTEAEDMGEVLSLDQTVTVPYGRFENCVMTKDFTPIEPDVEENKFYASGVGVVLEIDVESGERAELVDVRTDQ